MTCSPRIRCSPCPGLRGTTNCRGTVIEPHRQRPALDRGDRRRPRATGAVEAPRTGGPTPSASSSCSSPISSARRGRPNGRAARRPSRAAAAADRRRPGSRMIWVTWRQHRAQAIACLALFCALAALAITLGLSMRAAFSSGGLPACLARSGGARVPGGDHLVRGQVQPGRRDARSTCRSSRFPSSSGSWWARRCSDASSSRAPGGWRGPRPCRGPDGWSPSSGW